MRSVLLTFAIIAIALGFVVPSVQRPALANQAPHQAYCVPPNVFNPADPANARPFMRDWTHGELCPGQPGDHWTDGALFDPTVSFSGSNPSVAFPQDVYYVKGQRVYVAALSTSAPLNATSYWYLDAGPQCLTHCYDTPTPSASPGTSLWVSNTNGVPPNATSVLEYTIVANGSGVTSVTYGSGASASPVYANFFTNGTVAASDFTASNQAGHAGECAVYDSNGKTFASPCPTSGVATPNPFEAAILSRPDVTHFWEMHDNPAAGAGTPGPCPTGAGQIVDSIGSGATGNPSPVPLTVVTTSPVPPPTCGLAGMLPDIAGPSTSILFCHNASVTAGTAKGCGVSATHNSYLQIPSGTLPASPYTIGCIVALTPVTNAADSEGFYSAGSGTELRLQDGSSGVFVANINNVASGSAGILLKGSLYVFTNDGTTSRLFINAAPITAPTVNPSPPAGVGSFGDEIGSANTGLDGRMQDCWYANTAWPASTINYFYSLTGL